VSAQVLDRRSKHGLAGPRGTYHHHEPIPAGDRCRGVGLKDVKPVAVNGG
jgi:hypothetical protein